MSEAYKVCLTYTISFNCPFAFILKSAIFMKYCQNFWSVTIQISTCPSFLVLCVVCKHVAALSFFFIQVTADVGELLGEDKVDAVLCAAGGWAAGRAKA